MDLRWYGDDDYRIQARLLARELVGLQPDIILVSSTSVSSLSATAAVERETRTIPIVFVTLTDPVACGIVPRLDGPSENITGFANLEASL
jgi:putative ABC transport system substrate-binding protein